MKTRYQKSVIIIENVPPTKEPTDIDIAWMAGFFEGEGSVTHSNGKKASVSIPQKDPEILFRIREMIGGSISKTLREETYLHTLNLGGDNGRRFLQSIYPFMSSKRKFQIEEAGGLKFTGCAQWKSQLTQERRIARNGMDKKQRAAESKAASRERKREERLAYFAEYRAMNRESLNAGYRRRYAMRKKETQQNLATGTIQ